MTRFKSMMKKAFMLPALPTIIISLPSFALVILMLQRADKSPLAYFSYLLSAYALIISSTLVYRVVIKAKSNITSIVKSTYIGSMLVGDHLARIKTTLGISSLINLVYSLINIFSGVIHSSIWFISLGIYYTSLTIVRALLLAYIGKAPLVQNTMSEYRLYRSCGIILLIINQAMAGIVIYIVQHEKNFIYPGNLIYIMAVYTFSVTISAIVKVFKYRKSGSPVLSAAKIVSLASALVSMLSLETGMLWRFGNGDAEFRHVMTASSGGVICLIVFALSIHMIIKSSRYLKNNCYKLKNSNK